MAKAKQVQPANPLMEAVKFMMLTKSGYCRMTNQTAVAFDRILAVGQRIEDLIEACPDVSLLAYALSNCGEQFAITHLDSKLCVRSGEFEAFVPCCDPTSLPEAAPDAPAYPVSPALTDALKIAATVANDKAESLLAACLIAGRGSVMATDNSLLIDAWHGHDHPEVLLPKLAATAVVKSGKQLAHLGIGEKTVTFWFADGSWIRSQRYLETLAEIRPMRDMLDGSERRSAKEIDPAFFKAVSQIAPFSGDGRVYCECNRVASHPRTKTDNGGKLLQVECPHLRSYDARRLLIAGKYAKYLDECAGETYTLFYGDTVRGAIGHYKTPTSYIDDDEIPF